MAIFLYQASTGLRSDQTILLAAAKSKLAYPDRLRRVSYRGPDTNQHLVPAGKTLRPKAVCFASNWIVGDCPCLNACRLSIRSDASLLQVRLRSLRAPIPASTSRPVSNLVDCMRRKLIGGK